MSVNCTCCIFFILFFICGTAAWLAHEMGCPKEKLLVSQYKPYIFFMLLCYFLFVNDLVIVEFIRKFWLLVCLIAT